MALQFGFELEGFHLDDEGNIDIPSLHIPRDNFPGLVELRNDGGAALVPALFTLASKMADPRYNRDHVNFTKWEHTFTRAQLLTIRAQYIDKGGVEIRNLYNRTPRYVGNKTLASFQINMSDQMTQEYRDVDGQTRTYTTSKLLDIPGIIRGLDQEFKAEIKDTNRQPGFYAIKDHGQRLEYRSLPNVVFGGICTIDALQTLAARIQRAVG